MQWINDKQSYGWLAIALHWIVVAIVITMLVIGFRDMEAGAVSVRVHGKGSLGAKPKGEVLADLLSAIATLEDYWAYPGPRLIATVREALSERHAGLFARLVQKISAALLPVVPGRRSTP